MVTGYMVGRMRPLYVVDPCGVIQPGGVCAHKRGQLTGGNMAAVEDVMHTTTLRDHTVQAVATISAGNVVIAHVGSPFAINRARWFNGRVSHAIEGVGFGVEVGAGYALCHGLLSMVTGYMVGGMHTR